VYRVLTVAREYGSGGGRIARSIADGLGWKLLDRTLMETIAQSAQVDPELARRYDEQVDSWLHRISRRGLWHGAFEGVAAVTEAQFLDAENVAALGRSIIEEAHAGGNCVIVGRGAQSVLHSFQDVFHVFIYAPWPDRLARVRERRPEAGNIEELIRSTDQSREDYIRIYFGSDWKDPHLYQMMINSALGEDRVAEMIIHAIN